MCDVYALCIARRLILLGEFCIQLLNKFLKNIRRRLDEDIIFELMLLLQSVSKEAV